ncbi:MAG TPA: type II toxin-antitoxin system VapC family toxin [Candidatus Methylacidiphilales bacterium]|jgi:predicted nucleic acid-binding protein|nr:type II toxin-antitoxin system VapC family toxin [Candidatus Methylacidiphilales bacterium]
MITALDTNVLLDVLLPNENFVDAAIIAIESCARAGSLVVCELVYAELCGHFSNKIDCDFFLKDNEIDVLNLSDHACFLASRIWRQYRKQGGNRTRILPDFLIGAHAQVQASRLISRDSGFYQKLFPKLTILDPASGEK